MAVVLAIYGAVDLILLLAAKVVNERVKPLFRALGFSQDRKHARRKEKATERMCQLAEPATRRTKTNAKGQVTIPGRVAGTAWD
jgi:hypothetical protein